MTGVDGGSGDSSSFVEELFEKLDELPIPKNPVKLATLCDVKMPETILLLTLQD